MAAATEHLGFGITVSTTYESPYLLARKFSTLDHLTGGRIGWNIVTSLLDSAARNIIGRDRQIPHDERYAIAQEFLEVTYKLWEGSWEPDAVVRDRGRGVFTDAGQGARRSTTTGSTSACPVRTWWSRRRNAPRCCSRPARRPAGREFAARNAELVFASDPRPDVLRGNIEDIRRRAVAPRSRARLDQVPHLRRNRHRQHGFGRPGQGRRPGEIPRPRGRPGAVVGAERRRLVLLRRGPADRAVRHRCQPVDPRRGRRSDERHRLTLRDYVGGLGGFGGQLFVGSAHTVADELEAYAERAGVDGFNIAYHVTPGSFADVARVSDPRTAPAWTGARAGDGATTLRQRMFPAGSALLPDDHPGAQPFRRKRILSIRYADVVDNCSGTVQYQVKTALITCVPTHYVHTVR